MSDPKAIVDKAMEHLRQDYSLTIRQIGKHVYLGVYKYEGGKEQYESLCDFAEDTDLCNRVLDMLADLGAITNDTRDYLKRTAADKLAKVRARQKTVEGGGGGEGKGGGEEIVGIPMDVISKIISVPRNDQGALRELRDLVSHIVITTSQMARRYHALGFLTERIVLSKINLTNEEVMELWKASDEEYLARMLKYIADMADVYEHFDVKEQELKEEVERLREEVNKKSVDVAYLEVVLEDLKKLADMVAGLKDAMLTAIAANAPPEIVTRLVDEYIEAALRLRREIETRIPSTRW